MDLTHYRNSGYETLSSYITFPDNTVTLEYPYSTGTDDFAITYHQHTESDHIWGTSGYSPEVIIEFSSCRILQRTPWNNIVFSVLFEGTAQGTMNMMYFPTTEESDHFFEMSFSMPFIGFPSAEFSDSLEEICEGGNG